MWETQVQHGDLLYLQLQFAETHFTQFILSHASWVKVHTYPGQNNRFRNSFCTTIISIISYSLLKDIRGLKLFKH